jgi:RNA polymerase sigma-70 factor (ECF subfamily)
LSQDSTKAERFWKHLEPLQGALERYCRHFVQDASTVEDVLQSAVTTAFRDFDLFAEGTNFRAWIYRYLNLEIRAANRMTLARPYLELVEEPIADDEWILAFDEAHFAALLQSPERVLECCDDVLAAATRELNWLERSTLLLKAVGGFKYREISEILKLPMGTVMSALSRARQRLRHTLAEYGREHGLLTPEQSNRQQYDSGTGAQGTPQRGNP